MRIGVKMKTLVSVSDLSKEDILKIFDYTNKFERNEIEPYGFAKGKVLGLIFLQESLRTSASLKAAIIKLGGGWINFDLSYVKEGEEDLEDSVMAVAPLVDVLAMRGGSDIDIHPLSEKISTPIINSMIGMEHAISGLWITYPLWQRYKKLERLKVGVYGLTRYSRPAFALYRALSKFNVEFKEDPIIDSTGAPDYLIDKIQKNGSSFSRCKLEDCIGELDFLFVPEGLPVKGADENAVNEFNKMYKPLNNKMLEGLRKDSVFAYSMPRTLTDGRLVVEKEADSDPRLITYEYMEKSVYVNMGIIAWLLNIHI